MDTDTDTIDTEIDNGYPRGREFGQDITPPTTPNAIFCSPHFANGTRPLSAEVLASLQQDRCVAARAWLRAMGHNV